MHNSRMNSKVNTYMEIYSHLHIYGLEKARRPIHCISNHQRELHLPFAVNSAIEGGAETETRLGEGGAFTGRKERFATRTWPAVKRDNH